MELKNTFSAENKTDGIKQESPPKVFSVGYKSGSPPKAFSVGYNSVRGIEEETIKKRNRGEAIPRSKNERAER